MKTITDAYYTYTGKPINWTIAKHTSVLNWWKLRKVTKDQRKIASKISHVEHGVFVNGYIEYSGKLYLYPDQITIKQWFYFSSTMRDGAKGTRWICEKDLFKHPERWEVREEEVNDRLVEEMIMRVNSKIPARYDIPGLFGFVFPFSWKIVNDFKTWYCSEFCFWARYGVWRKVISPLGYYLLRLECTKRVK